MPRTPQYSAVPETPLHQALKHAGAQWALAGGYVAAAIEVHCPIARYRADVAAFGEDAPPPGAKFAARVAHTAIIECKASRSDFLRDDASLPSLLHQRERLQAELDRVEREVVQTLEPHLQSSGTFLFREMEPWDLAASRSVSYRLLVRALRKLDLAIHAQTKFFMLAHYRLADRLWVLAPRGLISPGELPRGWGLLERTADGVIGESVPPVRHDTPDRRRTRLLRNIAVAASRGLRPMPPTPAGQSA